MKNIEAPNKVPNHSHAWRGTWDRPMFVDEDTLHPFTVARMTDHNVRGRDRDLPENDKDINPGLDVDAQRHPEEQIVRPF